MPHAERANADTADEALRLRVHDGPPAVCASLRTASRVVNEVQVDVAESTLFKRFPGSGPDMVVAFVLLEFGCVEDRLARGAGLLAEVKNRAAALPLVLVPLRGVLGQSDRG